jgi:hypothetical protein
VDGEEGASFAAFGERLEELEAEVDDRAGCFPFGAGCVFAAVVGVLDDVVEEDGAAPALAIGSAICRQNDSTSVTEFGSSEWRLRIGLNASMTNSRIWWLWIVSASSLIFVGSRTSDGRM